MINVNISFPDDLREKGETRAKQAGCNTLEEYVTSLVQDDLRSDSRLGESKEDFDPALEELLEARLKDDAGTIEVTPEFFQSLNKDLQRRISNQ